MYNCFQMYNSTQQPQYNLVLTNAGMNSDW